MTRFVVEEQPEPRFVVEDSPAAVTAGKEINSIPRQLGLTARYGIEGAADMLQIGTEPLRHLVTDPLLRVFGAGQPNVTGLVTGEKPPPVSRPLREEASRIADWLGLPSPQTANERVVGDAARLVAGSGVMSGVARAAGGAASEALQFAGRNAAPAAQGAGQQVWQSLAAQPGRQAATVAGAGLAGGASREAGGGPGMQFAAALGGGVASGMATQKAQDLTRSASRFIESKLPGQAQVFQHRLDQRINIALESHGIDPATVSPAMRTALREQVGKATNLGDDLNSEAIARLADYTRLGMTPTRARLTLDPYDVTQEQNAAKLAAATGSREARLPQIAKDNNRRLIDSIDEMGGNRPLDAYGQGTAVAGTIRSQDEALGQGVTSLYQQARDTAGRPAPLDGRAFTVRASQLLDDGLLGGALPPSVEAHLNRIARGEVPFTVDYAEQLKTAVGNLQRASTDGQTRMALGIVRRALDETPLMPAGQVNPRNLPAVPGTVPPSPATLGQQSIDAFNQARAAARDRFAWREGSPAIGRALEGANADTFIQQNIISKAAGFDGVSRVAQTINRDPAARDAVRTAIIQHLKAASVGRGGTSATGNFSGRGMEAALNDIGARKLGLFFDPSEIETLRAMARTGASEVFQPRGSAVNNSNTAAGVGSLLGGIADYVRPVANKIPFGETLVSTPLDNLAVWRAQAPATNIPRGLLTPHQPPPAASGLLGPALVYSGGLLSLPPVTTP